MSLFYPYPHHHQQLRPLTMQTYHPFGSYYRPSLFSTLDNAARQLDKWAGDSQALLSSRRRQAPSVSGPRFTVEDTEDAYLLQGELPDMTSDDVRVEFLNATTLSVKGYVETIKHEGSTPDTANAKATETAGEQSTLTSGQHAPAAAASQEISTQPAAPAQPLQRKSRYRVTHRSVTQFQRKFTLPDGIDRDGVTTTFNNGKLKIVVPKPGTTAKRVEQQIPDEVQEQTTVQEPELSEPEGVTQVETQASESDAQVSAMEDDEWADVSEIKGVKSTGKDKKVQIETVDDDE